jgi:anti-sigma B factor antagonist
MVVSTTTGTMVELGAHLDVRSVGLARAMLYEVIEQADGDVVIDMTRVESIDAAGLGMLTAVHLRCERAGHRLVLRSCSREIRRVLAVTRLHRILHLDRAHGPLTA